LDTPSANPDSTTILDLPAPIARLEELARNFWWSWSAESRQLFRTISTKLWRSTDHNPVRLLRDVGSYRLDAISRDPEFLARYRKVLRLFDDYMTRDAKSVGNAPKEAKRIKIAYFSAEYGLHGSLPIYSGGLGVLAGDICKTASDLSIPDVAIERAFLPSGEPLMVDVPLESPQDLLHMQVWLVRCGRVKIYLMDSNVEANQPWNRDITTRLYGGDREYRLRQEIALGIGSVKVVHALGLEPDVWHANEGHVAFMFLERLREAMQAGGSTADRATAPRDIEAAKDLIRMSSVFTTHTPVPAGHDEFDMDLIGRYFWHYWPQLGLDKEQFFALGQAESDLTDFNMTALSMNLSARVNAVSKKHLEVTSKMWPELVTNTDGKQPSPSLHPASLTSVTNGVHLPTWLAPEMENLFTNEVGADWRDHCADAKYWERARNISDSGLWRARMQLKRRMFSVIDRARRKWQEDGFDPAQLVPSGMLLDPSILTIGFGRRFATYKRGTLIFNDLDRLKKILSDPLRPVQMIFSGKAHPADEGGKRLIKDIWQFALDPAFGGRIGFIENYGMHIAKYLVHGVDVWMNNPKAPLEASGTSGMKAAINGVPNFSILDGWWIEGYQKGNGWGLDGSTTGSQEEQDRADAARMYETLEKEIVPLYYDKGIDGIPRGWMKVAKESIATILPQFSSERMVRDYMEKMYR
jgi:starch phosphorylase